MDETSPTPPQNIGFHQQGGMVLLYWYPAYDQSEGSWVVAYHIYYGKKQVGIAYGTQYLIPSKYKKPEKFIVKSVNVAGVESE